MESQGKKIESFDKEMQDRLMIYMLSVRNSNDEMRKKLREANSELQKIMVKGMSEEESVLGKFVWFIIDNAPRYEGKPGFNLTEAAESLSKIWELEKKAE